LYDAAAGDGDEQGAEHRDDDRVRGHPPLAAALPH